MAKILEHGTLYYGDCLKRMRDFPDECVDLIYLDPPFNSSANYNIIYGTSEETTAQKKAFEDTWQWDKPAVERVNELKGAVSNLRVSEAFYGFEKLIPETGMLSYLSYMAPRLTEMKRLLKPTGSVYYHCDPTASHYVKILMDAIFGLANFRNEIVWKRHGASGSAKSIGNVHDSILYYAKTKSATYNPVYTELTQEEKQRFSHKDEKGFFQTNHLEAQEGMTGGGSKYTYKGYKPKIGWLVNEKKLKEMDEQGYVYWTSGGKPRRKYYLHESKGKLINNLWFDFSAISSMSKERTGYPTQKPLALLERIIKASSKKGDFVLDPFCGCGTTILAAQKLERKWAGIDITVLAIDIVENVRLKPINITPVVKGYPADMHSARVLAKTNAFEFETWAVGRIEGLAPNEHQRGDGGIDGRGTYDMPNEDMVKENLVSKKVIAQVKSGKFAIGQLREFGGVLEHGEYGFGIYITLDKVESKSANALVASYGTVKLGNKGSVLQEFPRLQLWSIEEYFNGIKPILPILLDPQSGKRKARNGELQI